MRCTKVHILFSLFIFLFSGAQAQNKEFEDELAYLFYNGLDDKFLYPGTLNEGAMNIYYTGHNDYSFYVIPVKSGDTLRASADVMQSTLLFLKANYEPASSNKTQLFEAIKGSLTKLKYSTVTCPIPQEARYLYVCNTINNDNVLPTELYIGKHNILEPKRKEISYKSSLKIKKEATIEYLSVLSQQGVKAILGEDVEFFDLPVMVVCDNPEKTIIIGAEAHCKSGVKWMTAISNDGGKSFKSQINYLHSQSGELVYDKDGKPMVVPITELIYDRINKRVLSLTASFCYASDDYGKTWYRLSYFGHKIERPLPFTNTMYCPTTGIQLSNGILVSPMRFFQKDDNTNKIIKSVNYVVYSKDYGKTWEQSPVTDEDIICDEALVVEYKKNQLMLNVRGGTEYWMDKTNNGRRVFIADMKSKNCLSGWTIRGWKTESESDGKIYDPICNASILKLPKSIKQGALFANPCIPGEYWPRKNILLRYSKDFIHWDNVSLLTPYGEKVRGYCALGASDCDVYFAYPDAEGRIMFGTITELIKDLK